MTKRQIKTLYVVFCLLLIGLFLLIGQRITRPHKVATDELEKKARHLMDSNPKAIFQFDPDLSYMLKPNFRGFRDESDVYVHMTNSRSLLGEEEIASSSSIKKIIFLGDSILYGQRVAYEETMTMIMQTLAGKTYQLANGGCPGWSTKQEILFYKKYLQDVDWKSIVIILCLNDLVNYEWIYDSESDIRLSADIDNVGGLYGLRTKVVESVNLWRMRKKFAADVRTLPLSEHNNTCLLAWEQDRWDKFYNDTLQPFLTGPNLPPLIIAIAPSRYQLEALRKGGKAKLVFYPQTKLQAYCRRASITCIDLAKGLSEGIRDGDLSAIYLDDLHLTPLGHRIVANYLWPVLDGLIEKNR